MCTPAVAFVAMAAATTASAIQQNQQTQHLKGAAQAQATEAAAAQAQATKIGPPQTSPVVTDQSAAITAANKKRQAAMASGMMSTFGPNGNPPAPPSLVSAPQAFATGMKTALGQ